MRMLQATSTISARPCDTGMSFGLVFFHAGAFRGTRQAAAQLLLDSSILPLEPGLRWFVALAGLLPEEVAKELGSPQASPGASTS